MTAAPVALRAATPDDIDAMIAVEADADLRYGDDHPELAHGGTIPRDLAERAITQTRVTVAVDDDVVVGWVLVTRSETELCIGQISVRRDAGGRGVGTALLRHVIDEARAHEESSIVLNTQADVAFNRPWYERHGFVVVPEAEWTDDMRVITQEQTHGGLDWSTRVHMRLVLD